MRLLSASLLVVTLPFATATAQEGAPTWRAQAVEHGLTPAQIATLEARGFVVGDKAVREVFEPYLEEGLPIFVTSDSLLRATQVLHEDSIELLELKRYDDLQRWLGGIWQQLQQPVPCDDSGGELGARSRRIAQIMIGTALRLLSGAALPEAGPVESGVREEIERQAQLALVAQARELPPWLAPETVERLAIDYQLMAPRGLHTKRPRLGRLFRATRWLQTIPLHIDRDAELLAWARIAHVAHPNAGDPPAPGLPADLDVLQAAARRSKWELTPDWAQSAASLRRYLAEKAEQLPVPAIVCRVGFVDEPERVTSVRILSARHTPDIALLSLSARERRGLDFDHGLRVGAWLGSELAPGLLPEDERQQLKELCAKWSFAIPSGWIYEKHWRCLQALCAPADADAPALFHSQQWRQLRLASALVGWVQLRHATQCQVKSNWSYRCLREPPRLASSSPCRSSGSGSRISPRPGPTRSMPASSWVRRPQKCYAEPSVSSSSGRSR